MLKNILAVLAMLLAAGALAAVDVNKGTVADLDGISGIGPVISKRILDERKKAPFSSWADLIARVRGIGPANAARYSAEGLRIDGVEFNGAAALPRTGGRPAPAPAR